MNNLSNDIKKQIGLSSASFYPDIYTEDSISLMKKLDFNIGEVFLNTPREYEDDFINKLKYESQRNNFYINSVHAFSSSFEPYLFDSYKRRKEDMLIPFKKICKAAKNLGAKCYTFHGLRLDKGKEIRLKSIIDVYDEIIYIALSEGIKLAQENVSWCMSADIYFLEQLLERCKYPINFTFDIKQAYKAKIAPELYLDIMGDKVINFHINDNDSNNMCLLPGKGNINYVEIYKKLKKIDYNGVYIIEVYRDNYINYKEITEAKRHLEKIFI
ncbi:sugar phosphate isomerase/epimerase family protein [Clostridium rectalis]|uniref:sugar phosphate isomerase/epimerase family protein n=1 Tax=Clostridium rectalis TaxID=2040295 RepID=UPI000F63022F|nr:sugar phosphate isomerase/epimerase [Clostridium rectalis]